MDGIKYITWLYILLGNADIHSATCLHIHNYVGKTENASRDLCNEHDVCRKTFNVTFLDIEPYFNDHGGNFTGTLESLLNTCCGTCKKMAVVNVLRDMTKLTPQSINTSHFVFPILGRTKESRLYGRYFMPIIEAPNGYYISKKENVLMHNLFHALLDLHPVIIVCLLMALMSGFGAWILETWNNKNEFPRPFFRGWFEGFWWSFVSMTTVGYGDKVPKSLAARLYAVTWILIGITSFSLITALLTAEVSKAIYPTAPNMIGAKVGGLKHRIFDAYIIARNGGKLDESHHTNDVDVLINRLRHGKIDGFLLDKYTTWYSTDIIIHSLQEENPWRFSQEMKDDFVFFQEGTIKTEIIHDGVQFSYGVLVKHLSDYEYFREAVSDNRIITEIQMSLQWNAKPKKGGTLSLVSPYYFNASLVVIAIIIGVMLCVGITFELKRKKEQIYKAGRHLMSL